VPACSQSRLPSLSACKLPLKSSARSNPVAAVQLSGRPITAPGRRIGPITQRNRPQSAPICCAPPPPVTPPWRNLLDRPHWRSRWPTCSRGWTNERSVELQTTSARCGAAADTQTVHSLCCWSPCTHGLPQCIGLSPALVSAQGTALWLSYSHSHSHSHSRVSAHYSAPHQPHPSGNLCNLLHFLCTTSPPAGWPRF
jgi:hypothetical protein